MAFPQSPDFPSLLTFPNRSRDQATFDVNMAATFTFYGGLDTWSGEFEAFAAAWSAEADSLAAALVAGNLPPLAGAAGKSVVVNPAEDDVDFRDVNGLISAELYTSSQTIVLDANTKKIRFEMAGGGGGGGSAAVTSGADAVRAGSGGNAGTLCKGVLDVAGGPSITFVRGSGGVAAADGGDTTLTVDSVLYTASGGDGGVAVSNTGFAATMVAQTSTTPAAAVAPAIVVGAFSGGPAEIFRIDNGGPEFVTVKPGKGAGCPGWGVGGFLPPGNAIATSSGSAAGVAGGLASGGSGAYVFGGATSLASGGAGGDGFLWLEQFG